MNPRRIYAFGPFRLMPERQALLHGEAPVRIGARAFDLLTAFVERPGELISKAELMARAWPDTVVDDANLKVNMAALRRALEGVDDTTQYVATIAGRGYRFVAPVRASGAGPQDIAAQQRHINKLPIGTTRIFGRADFISSTFDDLAEARLVSIVGPGGVGKTTVAVAIAEQMIPSARDGVWFIDLAVTRNPEFAASVIGTSLGIATPAASMLDAVCAYLRDRDAILVLDSCEHIIEAAAACASRILASTVSAKILVTSREPLDVPGERVRRLPGLEMPPDLADLKAEQALTFPAVQLFVERATDKLEAFILTDADAPVVAAICRRLDGLALAIEFAAARIDEFGASSLLEQLNDCFLVLARRYAEPERHRTLGAALEWSYHLLASEEAKLLRASSVFADLFSVDDICAVTATASGEAARILSRLAAKSLLSTAIDAAGIEYRLLETTRAYCLDRLSADEEENTLFRKRHAELVCAKLERGSREWALRSSHAWSAAYGQVLGDLRSAIAWLDSGAEQAALRIRITVAGLLLWNHYSLTEECRAQASKAVDLLEVAGETGTAAEMHLKTWLGSATIFTAGLTESAMQTLHYAMGLAIRLGDSDCHMRCLRALGLYQHLTGQHVAGSTTFEAYGALATRVGTPSAPEVELQIAMSEYFLGRVTSARRRLDTLRAHMEIDAAVSQPVRFLSDVNSQMGCALAMVEWLTGSLDTAVQTARGAVAYAIGTNHHLSLSDALNAACPLLYWSGQFQESGRYVDMLDELSSRHEMRTRRPIALFYRAALTCSQYGPPIGLRGLMEAVEAFKDVGHMARMPYYLSFLADAQAKCGNLDEAVATVEAAVALAHAQSEGWCLPEVQRVKASVFELLGRTDEAIRLLQRAMTVAQEAGGLWMRLRAAIDLAELLRRSDAAAAYDMLLPVCSAFVEGFETPDLVAANRILDELKPARGTPTRLRA